MSAAGGITTTGAIATTTGGNVSAGNVLATGIVSATGNVYGNYFIGNGSQLTGIAASYGNANVTTLLAALGSNTISSTGNITTTANIAGGNVLYGAGVVSGTGTVYATTISATGNVSANYYIGNGSQLTGITATSSYGNANVATFLAAFGSNTISSTGNITTSANISVGNIVGVSAGTGTRLINYKDTVYAIGNSSGTITPDVANGSIQTTTATGNITFNAFGGTPQTGQSLTLIITQDTTGSRLLTSTMKFAGAYKILSTTANATDIMTVFYDGTTYWASLNIGYA